jgi:hypothetical protein
MRRLTIRVGYVMELVVAAAVCFAVVRSQMAPGSHFAGSTRSSGWVRLVGGSLLTGLALAGGLGLAAEAARRRRPATWGLGRWVWSISGLFVVFYGLWGIAVALVNRWTYGGGSASFVDLALNVLVWGAIGQFFGGFAWAIAGFCTTAMIVGSLRDPDPDAREWAGRLFASLAVAVDIAEVLLRSAGW